MVKEVKIQIPVKMYYTRKNTSSIRNFIGLNGIYCQRMYIEMLEDV